MALDAGEPSPVADLLAGLEDPAVTVDEAGLVTGWNAAAAERFAVPAETARGRSVAEVIGSAEPVARLALGPRAGGGQLLAWRLGGAACEPTSDDAALQKAEALGRLAGGFSHDVANRFMGIQGYASLIVTDPSAPAGIRETARSIEDHAAEALRVIRAFLEVARDRAPAASSVLVERTVRDVLDIAHNALGNLTIQDALPDSLPQVNADSAQLRQALLAVIMVAIEQTGGRWQPYRQASGRLRVSGHVVGERDAGRVRLVIEDDGASGAGRGSRDLAVARALISAGGGRLAYEPLPAGNRCVIDLPITGAVLPAEGFPPEPEPEPAGPATVLVCDDEASVRAILVRFVGAAGYRTIAATGGREALERLEANAIDVVITDHRMAGMTGIELYRRAVELRPALRARFILTSGDADSDLTEFADREGIQILGKPFTGTQVTDAVRRLLGH